MDINTGSVRGRCDLYESRLPLIGIIYFPTAPSFIPQTLIIPDIYMEPCSSYLLGNGYIYPE